MTLVASVLPDPWAESREPFDGMEVSEEAYWEIYYEYPDRRFEWCDGCLEETGVSHFLTALMYRWFFELLGEYLRHHPIADLIFLDTGFRLDLGKSKRSIRKPDFAVILNSNAVTMADEHHSYRGTFDLCVEALSDLSKKDIKRDTVTKVSEYAAVGVREYYILHHDLAQCAFYQLGLGRRYRSIENREGVIRSSVLEGFQFRVKDLAKRPAWIELADDPVYADFVMVEYQEALKREEMEKSEKLEALQRERREREKAIAEHLRAEAEKVRANDEKSRADAAEAEVIRLKALLEGKS